MALHSRSLRLFDSRCAEMDTYTLSGNELPFSSRYEKPTTPLHRPGEWELLQEDPARHLIAGSRVVSLAGSQRNMEDGL